MAILRRILAVSLLALIALTGTVSAQAALDAFRAQGVIAERFDGFAETRGNAPPEARQLVDQVNAKRREIYAQRAREQNVPVEEVGKIYALQLVDKLPPGTYVRKPDGSYAQK